MSLSRRPVLVALITSLLAVLGAGAACLPAPPGLSVWFRLEDSSQDHLSGLTGVVPASATYAEGKVGRGIALDGLSGVNLPADERFARGAFTLETWVRRADLQRASKGSSGSGVIFAGGRSSYSLTMSIDGRLYLSHVDILSYNFDASITDLEWHHLCMVRSGGLFRLYVDGLPGGQVNVPGNILTTGPFTIGALPDFINDQYYAFWGTLDELSLYPRELAESEIVALAGAVGGKCTEVVPSVPACEPQPTGLVGWFPLDDDARNLADASLSGGTSAATFGPGYVRKAAFFDGMNPGFILPTDPKLKSQNFTIETWIQRASTAASSQASPPDGAIYSGGTSSYGMSLRADGLLYLNHVGGAYYLSSGQISDLGWHHIAVTKSGGTVAFYLDGNPAGTADLGSLEFDLSTPFAIGSLGVPFGGISYTFWGGLDELSVYDRPLSSEEIRKIWARRSSGKCLGGLGLTIQAPGEVVVDGAFSFDVTVINQEDERVSGVVVTNALPAGFRVTATESATGASVVIPEEAGSRVLFIAGDLAPGAQASLRISVTNAPLGVQRLESTAAYAGAELPVSTSASVHVRPLCSPVPAGLASWWKGEGNTLDTISGIAGGASTGVSYAEGRIGSAFRLDGQNGTAVNLGSPATLQRSEFSIEAWIRRGSPTTVSPNSAGGTILGADTDGWNFALLNTGALTFGRSDISAVTTAALITDLAWHHVAVTRSAGEVRLYRDGQLALAQPYTETFKLNQDYGIGGIFPSGRNAFLGDLDEIAFYDRVLTAEEIAAVSGAGGAPKCVEDLVLNSAAGGFIPLGEDWEVPWVISSVGSSDSTGVTFVNAVPPGLLVVSAAASQGTVENLAGVLRGNLGTIPAGSNAVVRVVLKPLVAGPYAVTATVARAEGELSVGNNRLEIPATAVTLTLGLAGDVTVVEPATAEFEVVLSAPSTRTVSATYTTVAGTALAGADFEAQAGVLEFPPGIVRQTVRVPVVADGLYELDESFTVVLSNVVNATPGLAGATGTINSVDPLPVARVRPIAVSEGNSGQTLYRFEVILDRPSGLAASLAYATTNDTAKSPTDFTATQGTLQFAPGETNGVIEVLVNGDTAVEPNETFLVAFSQISGLRFPAAPPAPAVGTILNDDSIPGLASAFSWAPLPSELTTGEPFAAGLSALDGSGAVVPGYSGVVGVQAYAGPGLPSSVILTDVAVTGVRGVQLQNVSPTPVDVSGWTVYFYDASRWPAPRATFTVPAGTQVDPSVIFTVESFLGGAGAGAYPRFRINQVLQWYSQSPQVPVTVGVVVTDAFGVVQDSFFAGEALPGEVGVPAVLSSEDWFGPSVAASPAIGLYRRAQGQNRNARRATDWQTAGLVIGGSGLGRPNPGLQLPFADAVLIPVAPDAVSGFVGGHWSGNLTLTGFAPVVRLIADDGNGHRGLSTPASARVVDDLLVTMEAQPRVLTIPSWSSDFVVTVTNLGPVLSSNVTAQVLLAPQYGPSINAIAVPQVTQGTVRLRSVGIPVGGFRVEVTAEFGDLPAGGSATLTFNAYRTSAGSFEPPAELESVATLTRAPVELNLLNNRATVVQELSTSCAPLGTAAVAWWPAEAGFNDVLGGLAGTAVGGIALGEGRVGAGGFHFDGVDDALRIADAEALDFGTGDSFTLEAWIRVPQGAPDALAVLGKAVSTGETLTGYVLSLAEGFPAMDIGDGVTAAHWQIGSPGRIFQVDLRDGRWHHLAIIVDQAASTRVRGWVDGEAWGSSAPSPLLDSLATDAALLIGGPLPGRAEAPFVGDLDEVVIHRGMLSMAEVRAAHAAGAHGHCASDFALTPVTPRFVVQPLQWIAQDAGVAGRPYRFQFNLTSRGPLAGEAFVRIAPLANDTNLTLFGPSGPVAFNPETFEARVQLGLLAPGTVVPLSVSVTSTNPSFTLSLLGSGTGLNSRADAAGVQIFLAADTDLDGIPDTVELAGGLDPLSAADAGSDGDGDGYTAAQEFEAGTAANNAASALRLRVVDDEVVFDALASRVYRLEQRDFLEEGSWNLIQEIRPQVDGVLPVGPLGEAGAGYYRVVVALAY